ncbi:MAG: hypothetical protein QM751_10710 [Paludibacteraceae bacterium]
MGSIPPRCGNETNTLKVYTKSGLRRMMNASQIGIIRLSRHRRTVCGMAVSCSANHNIKAKINKDGLWVEKNGK